MAHQDFSVIYKSKLGKLPGTSYKEVVRAARREHNKIRKRSPHRQPYIKSRYFTRDKIFINDFWAHLGSKVPGDRLRRLKLFLCAVDLIRNSTLPPRAMQNPNDPNETLHQFTGMTRNKELFYVHVRENKKTGRKGFMSVFPGK
ncbi:MAG: hypothetical protein WDZ34_01830 [Candidatus Saccharimonadales bacterium]